MDYIFMIWLGMIIAHSKPDLATQIYDLTWGNLKRVWRDAFESSVERRDRLVREHKEKEEMLKKAKEKVEKDSEYKI